MTETAVVILMFVMGALFGLTAGAFITAAAMRSTLDEALQERHKLMRTIHELTVEVMKLERELEELLT